MITKKIKDRYKRIIPIPKKADFNDELIQLGSDWCIKCDKKFSEIATRWIEKFGLSESNCDKVISFCMDPSLEEEEYKIKIGTEKLKVLAASKKGIDYAFKTLWQLSPEGEVPTGIIEDKPLLKMRGFHINFESFRQMDANEAIYVLKTAADLKLNTVLLEYENRFPFRKHRNINVRTTLTREEINRINDTAEKLGITIIPLQQTIGHLEYMLKHEEYSSIRENRESISQVCPLNPDSLVTIKELIDDIIEAHPGIKNIHIGGDEARSLGICKDCSEKVKKYGVSRLYIDYINSICEYVCSKGISPYIWDDMICAHPEAIELLDKRVTILYWDYWTINKSTPYFVTRYNRQGKDLISHDNRWNSEWKDELDDLERDIITNFSTGVMLEDNLGKEFIDLYGEWLGKEFPKRIKGYPYIDFYINKGLKVVGAPTCLGNGDNYHTLPNYWRFIPNIRTVCERCIESGAEGVITTAWYNYHPSMFHLGIGATAQFAWGVPAVTNNFYKLHR